MALTSPQNILPLLEPYWLVLAGAFGVSVTATPICRRIARRRRLVDRPDDFLKPHKKPIPYLGGVAIFAGWAAGIGIVLLLGDVPVRLDIIGGTLIAGLAIMLIGLSDDLHFMSPRVKLILNILVALWLFWIGIGRNTFHTFFPYTLIGGSDTTTWLLLAYSLPFTLFVVVGACNATNLIDGLDGLCSGVLGIVSIGYFLLALHMASWNPTAPDAHERVLLAAAMLGAALGFLPYNVNPATIFMGDAGSMLLGLNAAVLILLFCDTGFIRWMFGAIFVFGLPIADMMLTLVRRWRNGRPVMLGDRSHFYDQLIDRGYSVRQVVAISYLLTAVFVAAGCLTAIFVRTRYAPMVYGAVVVAVIYGVVRFQMVNLLPPSQRGHTAGGASEQTKMGTECPPNQK